MRVTALAGGVGGAKLAHGLYQTLQPNELTVIANTGDDFEHLGLYISPDVDTLCYTLGGLVNSETGWGLKDESWNTLEAISALGGPDWFRLGDRDLATHLERTRRMAQGQAHSEITAAFCALWGVEASILPMSDQPVRTLVETEQGWMGFQEYFVRHRFQPRVKGFSFSGIEKARPAPGVLDAIAESDFVVFCPSNPWVSIDPILDVPGIRESLIPKPIMALSPVIGGRVVKGPAAKMFTELGIEPSALAVAEHYTGLVNALMIDAADKGQKPAIEALGIMTLVSDILMRDNEDRQRLATEVIALSETHFSSNKTSNQGKPSSA